MAPAIAASAMTIFTITLNTFIGIASIHVISISSITNLLKKSNRKIEIAAYT